MCVRVLNYLHVCVSECLGVWINVCMYILVYMYVFWYTRGCMHEWHTCMGTRVSILWVYVDSPSSLCVRLRVTAFRTRSCDPNSATETRTWFGVVLVMHPIHWRFEDRCTGWSRDLYQFMQWRPDDDSVPKLRHFMWVFALVLSSYLSLSVVLICYLHYFIWLSNLD